MYTPPGTLSSALRGALTDRFSVAQHHNFLRGYQLHNDYFENEHFCQWKGKKNVRDIISRWCWDEILEEIY